MVRRNQPNVKIATAFAGNLQSNRFLALVSNIDEYKKALEVANDSEGTGTLQFNKTLDNIETRLTKLKTAWQLFYTDSGIEKAIKNVITGLTNILNRLNKMPKLFKVIPLNALTMIASIISGVKLLAQAIANKIIAAIEQVREKARQAIHDTEQEANASADRTSQHIQNNGKGGTTGKTSGIVGSSKGYKIASGVQIAGSVLSLLGSSGIIKNETANTVISGIGRTVSLGATGFKVGGPWGALIGGGLGVVLGIIDLFNVKAREAEQKLEELKQKADEAENKRLESKQTVSNLEDYVKQYQEMAKAQYDSNDMKQQFLDLNAEIAEKYPDLLIQYDAEGNKIIQLTELQKKLNEEKAGYGKTNFNSIKTNYNVVKTERDNVKTEYNKTSQALGFNELIDNVVVGDIEKTFTDKWTPYLNGMAENEKEYFLGLYNELEGEVGPEKRAKKASEYFSSDFGVQVLKKFRDNLINAGLEDSGWVNQIEDWINDRNEYLPSEKKLKSQQLKGAQSYMSSTFHYGDKTFEDYSPIYQMGKKAGFNLDQYIGNIFGSYTEERYQELLNNEEEWAKEAQELAEGFQEAYLNNPEDAKFIGDIQNQSQADIKKFIDKDGIDSQVNYQKYLKATWEEIQNNLENGLNYINEKLVENGLVVGEENAYGDLSSYITNSNISLWRGIAENDKEHFDTYYQMVANLASSNPNLSIKDITDTILQSDLSTMTGIAELRKTLKTKGAWSEDSEIESLLKQAESMVKINPALEFAAMFDTYKKAYEELDKLASSLSTGLELKDAISWAAKMGKSINDFTQKEGKFYVSQEQFWGYVNTQLPLLNDVINKTDEFYEKLEVDSGKIVGKAGSGIEDSQLEIIQGLYDSWKNDKNQGDLATFIKEQKDNVSAEASSALKALLESYAIQSIRAFGRINKEVRDMMTNAGFTEDAIKAMEDKYSGPETTSTLFSTGKIDVANWDKLPRELQEYVNKTTGQITNYGKALEALATGIGEGTIDPSYASIYAEGISTAKSDLEAALNGTLDGARVEVLKTQGLINKYSLILDKETGKYKIDFSKYWGGYKLIVKNLM